MIHSTGPILLEAFADLANVKAIVWAGLPGQESGNALVDVLYGEVSPSGKLPFTIAKKASDYGTSIQSTTDNFSEGLYIDYRAFDKKSITPRYEFGYGICKLSPLSFSAVVNFKKHIQHSIIPISTYQAAPLLDLNPAQPSLVALRLSSTW